MCIYIYIDLDIYIYMHGIFPKDPKALKIDTTYIHPIPRPPVHALIEAPSRRPDLGIPS